MISARIDPDLKQNAESVFEDLGLTASQAITLFYKQVEMAQGLPFPVRLPSAMTVEALRQAQDRRELATFNTIDDLIEDLGV